MKALNDKNVMHRDLKCENIMLNFPAEGWSQVDKKFRQEFQMNSGNFQIKLADFGFSKELEEDELTASVYGTPLYMAPEILNRKPYTTKADVWSLGCIFYEILIGTMPFNARDYNDLIATIEAGLYSIPKTIGLS